MYHNLKGGGEEGGGDKVEHDFKKEMFLNATLCRFETFVSIIKPYPYF
jgi:hypothetical protein